MLLCHPTLALSVDATASGVAPSDLDALQWTPAFEAMAAIEGGAHANVDERRQVGHYWLRAPERAPTLGQSQAIGHTVARCKKLADDILNGRLRTPDLRRFTDVLHVGIGGSSLGAQLLCSALAEPGGGLNVHFVDNADPQGVQHTLARVGDRLGTTMVVVASKSGTTPEVACAQQLVHSALREQKLDVAKRSVAITQEGSPLAMHAERAGWLAVLPIWSWVGGRFSTLSAMGLFSAALAGVDVDQLLEGARSMDDWTRTPHWHENPAAMMAGLWRVLHRASRPRNMVVLPYADNFGVLSRFMQQIVMESVGKDTDLDGQRVRHGLTVLGYKGSTDQHSIGQQLRDGPNDFFALFVQVLAFGERGLVQLKAADTLQGMLLGTRAALADSDRPSIVLTVPAVNAFLVGGVVALFERTVGLYAQLAGINAYHQPGVEAGKVAARQLLELSDTLLAAIDHTPTTAERIATTLGTDPSDVFHLLSRMASSGRLSMRWRGYGAEFWREES